MSSYTIITIYEFSFILIRIKAYITQAIILNSCFDVVSRKECRRMELENSETVFIPQDQSPACVSPPPPHSSSIPQ